MYSKPTTDTTGLRVIAIDFSTFDVSVGYDRGFYEGTIPKYNVRKYQQKEIISWEILESVAGKFNGADYYGGISCNGGLLYIEDQSIVDKIIDESKKERIEIAAKRRAQEKSEMIRESKEIVQAAEMIISSGKKLMTEEQARIWRKNYNDIANEGGEGYVPCPVTVEQYEQAKTTILKTNKGEAK